MKKDINAIILAGGKSRRMGGKDKAFLKIGETTFIERIINRLKYIFSQIIVVINSSQRPLFQNTHYRFIEDIKPDQGPLMGLYTGLSYLRQGEDIYPFSRSDYNFVVACDMPFLNQDLIRYMISQTRGYDVVTLMRNKNIEPLHSLYSSTCLHVIERQLKTNNHSLVSIYPKLDVRYIKEREIIKYDPDYLSLSNLNEFEEYSILRQGK